MCELIIVTKFSTVTIFSIITLLTHFVGLIMILYTSCLCSVLFLVYTFVHTIHSLLFTPLLLTCHNTSLVNGTAVWHPCAVPIMLTINIYSTSPVPIIQLTFTALYILVLVPLLYSQY